MDRDQIGVGRKLHSRDPLNNHPTVPTLTIRFRPRQNNMLRRAFLQSTIAAPGITAAWKQGPPRQFAAEILRMMEVGPVPGAVIGTLRDGKLGWIHPLGVCNIETKDPIRADTIFQAASLSKQAAAYAAFALREKGKLDFDKPLVSYVDDLEDGRARTVTARHVLSHSSGFPNWRGEAGQKLVPDFTPGSKFQYSGEGFFYLQRVMEQITGQGFGELMNALVFEPLQMVSGALYDSERLFSSSTSAPSPMMGSESVAEAIRRASFDKMAHFVECCILLKITDLSGWGDGGVPICSASGREQAAGISL